MKMLQEAQEISIQVVRVLSYQVKHFGKEKGKAVLVLMWKIPILLNAEDRYITKRVIKKYIYDSKSNTFRDAPNRVNRLLTPAKDSRYLYLSDSQQNKNK